MYLSHLEPVILYSQISLSFHHMDWMQSDDCQVAGIPLLRVHWLHVEGLQLLIPFHRSSPLGHAFDQYLRDIS